MFIVFILFVFVIDMLVRMVKINIQIRGLMDLMGRELKILVFVNDILNMVRREVFFLVVLWVVLILFCVVSGMRINWNKIIVMDRGFT